MKWTDEQEEKWVLFEDLKNGDGFEKDGLLFIKTKVDEAFNVILNMYRVFDDDDKVILRKCEIIFH